MSDIFDLDDRSWQLAFDSFNHGKAIVSRRPSFSKGGLKGEPKPTNWLLYGQAFLSDPIVFRAILSVADLVVSYGFYFDFPSEDGSLKRSQQASLSFLTDWSSFIDLHSCLRDVVADLLIYGNAFVEKVSDSSKTGWVIRSLKIIHPATVYVDRSDEGEVLRYYQRLDGHSFDPDYLDDLPRSTRLQTLSSDPSVLSFPPSSILHFKWNNPTNATYGRSSLMPLIDTINIKLGLLNDMVSVVQHWADPPLAWMVGNDKFSNVSISMLNRIKQIIDRQAHDKNIALPYYVDPQPIGGRQTVLDLNPYLSFINNEIIKGLGVPDVILGSGDAGKQSNAEAKQEAFVRFLKSIQLYLSNFLRRELFSHLFFSDRFLSGSLRPTDWRKVPSLHWRPIEDIANQRLRLQALVDSAILSPSQARLELGLRPHLSDEDLSPHNLLQLSQASLAQAQAQATLHPPEPQEPNEPNEPKDSK